MYKYKDLPSRYTWSLLAFNRRSNRHCKEVYYIVACRLVSRQRPRNKRDKQLSLGGHQRPNGLAEQRSRGNPKRHERNYGTATQTVFSTRSVQMDYKEYN
jgi:hypothetical protein